ncbi:hypothetical protein BPTFM16_01973 [Altererythrobacter insulae]|nr:hypothetical protein BPTFM16_01973 [Altererythrobacter insulae]
MPIAKMMKVPPEIVQFLGSLVAIFALAGLAWWLKLGGRPKLDSEAAAIVAANEVMDGFSPRRTSVDLAGQGAILQDQDGRVLVLKPHGNKFAGRILSDTASAQTAGTVLEIRSGERRYGTVSLEIEDARIWADRVNALGLRQDA